jgi:hypothetical protein
MLIFDFSALLEGHQQTFFDEHLRVGPVPGTGTAVYTTV